jgi:galactokinase
MDSKIDTIPLAKIYPATSLPAQKDRYAKLAAEFKKQYSVAPSFIARSPGRVNLIGEHIDYSWYSVLPMALSDNDIVIAVSITEQATNKNTSTLNVSNIQSGKFPSRSFEFGRVDDIAIDPTKHEWTNYFLSGFKGVLNELNIERPVSLNCLVDGTVPAVSFVLEVSSLNVCVGCRCE